MLRIATATEKDIPLILSFIRKIAEYEKLLHKVTATEELLRRTLFGERRMAEAALAYWEDKPAGFALYFHNVSTFLGRPGLYLEDLYVEPEHRRKGIGRALMIHLAKLARDRGCGRLEWAALNWNQPAIEFYKKLGAAPMHDWTVFRVTGEALEKMASLEQLTPASDASRQPAL